MRWADWLLDTIWWPVARFFWRLLCCRDCRSLADAARNGHRVCLNVNLEHGQYWPMCLSILAASNGHLNILECLQWHQYEWDRMASSHAAAAGHVHCLRYLLHNGATFDEFVWHAAAINGHLKVLKWLLAQGCPGFHCTAAAAADGCQLDCLEWAFNQWPSQTDDWVSYSAMQSGSLACLRLAVARGCPLKQQYYCQDQGCLRWALVNCPHVPAMPTTHYFEALAAVFTSDVLHRVYERDRNERASAIQNAWLVCYYAPWHPMCKKRLAREFEELNSMLAVNSSRA